MQQSTVYSHIPAAQPVKQPGKAAQRLTYLVLVILIIALMAGGLYWVQWAAQRGLTLGYPRPSVHIAALSSNTLQLHSSTQFSASATGRDLTYAWDFGDGANAAGADVNHAFQQDGSFTVTVTVTDALNQSSAASVNVLVYPPRPTASFTYTDYGYGQAYFDATNSSADPSTSISQYDWNFGDGSTDQATSPQDSHRYSYYGTYQVTLTVIDATGQTSDPYTINVTVA